MRFHNISAARGRRRAMRVAAVSMLVGGLACGGASGAPDAAERQGELHVALGVSLSDVTALRIDIVAADDDCSGEVIESATIELLPPSSRDDTTGESVHRQASGVLLVPAGDVRVCVTPLAGDRASEHCRTVDDVVRVESGQLTDVELLLQCGGADEGALSAVVTFNEAPRMEQLRIDPGELITTCDTATLSVLATDVDGDELSYVWSVGDALRLRPYEGEIESAGSVATFSASIPGEYLVNVVVDDGHGGQSALSVPIQVGDGACAASR